MDAVISGRAGTALLKDGNSLFSFDVDDVDTVVPRQQADLPFLFGDASDLQFLENVDAEQARRQLELAHNNACALDLTLILLDAELSDEVREEAAAELEELFAATQIIERLESILYARPLPGTADIIGAMEHSRRVEAATVASVLQRLRDRQPVIRQVHQEWDAIPATEFGGVEQKAEFQHTAVHEGLFRALVIAYVEGKVAGFLIDALRKPAIRALRNHRDILQRWTASFRSQTYTPPIQKRDEEFEPEPLAEKGRKQWQQHQGIDRFKVRENVEKRKQIIVEHLHRRDFDGLRSLVDELVEYQLANGKPKFLVMSLCDLAIEAKLFGNPHLQLELTERCIELQPDDAWSWAQYADALLNMQRPVEALNAYEQADSFGAGVIAKTGRAETLKALGRLKEALAAYDAAIASHPENVVAKNGRAGTLRALGRLKEALAAYEATIAAHPEDVFAKSGQAETLRALGHLNKALAAYDAAIVTHPEDVFAKTGRAETLKALGRLKEALAAYDAAIASHPENVVAKNGRAGTLRALGHLNEALAAYDAVIATHPEDIFAKSGRAETLRALGHLNEALVAYDAVIAEHPEHIPAKSGRAETLRALGRLDDALAAYDTAIATHPENMIARNGRSCILAALRRYEEALENLPDKDLNIREDWIGYHIRGMILLRMGRVDEAFPVFEQGVIGNPWSSDREFFRIALGIAWMRQQNFPKASEVLKEVSAPALQPQADILRIHSYGETGELELAEAAYKRVSANPQFQSHQLTDELHRRYILREQPQHDDDWVFDQEVNLFLLTANQSLTSSSLYYS